MQKKAAKWFQRSFAPRNNTANPANTASVMICWMI